MDKTRGRGPDAGPDDVTHVGLVARTTTLIDTGVDRPAVVDDGLSALVAFHDDIRTVLQDLDGIARGIIVDDDAIAAVRDFLTGPLTWHDEDEEVTLLARLRRRRVWSVQLTHVTAGHEKLEDLLDHLVPLLDDVAAHRAAVIDDATRLRALLTGHLHLEEEFLFPLVRRTFDTDALIEMGAEIESRHQRRRGKASATSTATGPAVAEATRNEATLVTPVPPPDLVATRFRVVTTTPASPAKPTPKPAARRSPIRAAPRPLPATASVSLRSISGSAVDDD